MAGLEDQIVGNPLNKSNLDTLINSFNSESFVPFIGAGPSTVLGAAGWEKLLSDLCKSFSLAHFKKAKKDGKVDYPKTFSNLFKNLNSKGTTSQDFFEKLFNCIRPTITQATYFHVLLVKLFDSCITTNYDHPLEKTFQDQYGKPPAKYFFTCYGLDNLKKCIVYLHGHKDLNFCIIKEEDYDYFYPSVSGKNGMPILEHFLSEVFGKKNVIFIGFSFDDKYFEDCLSRLHAIKPFANYHYWLLSESSKVFLNLKQRAEEYIRTGFPDKATAEVSNFFHGKMNIKPIVYREHVFVENLLQKLIESLPTATTSAALSGVPVR